jgi:beta-phosphoglucomutase-like phosphatase (HAD superfamily)/tRNA(Arg) A34 adenosine deaminase TadA
LDGIIFDLDGTLVDTNALHVEAWRRAFERLGYRAGTDRIAQELGKGGDQLVPAIFGHDLNARDGDAMRDAQPNEFGRLCDERGVGVVPGARQLVRAVRDRGIRTALSTSSGQDHLRTIERHAGLELRSMFDELVTSDDIERSKPAPDALTASLRKLRLSPALCAMLGDTVFDAAACVRGGVSFVGLTCGGTSRDRLRGAGARVVYRDPAEVLDHLDEAIRIVSPGSARFTVALIEQLMRDALEVARAGMDAGEAPIGCVVARGDATIIARAHNEQNRTRIKTAHAEMAAFARAAEMAPLDAKDLVLVSTLEPCVMCTGAAMEAGVDTIVFGLRAPADSGTVRVAPPVSPESQMPRIIGDVLSAESRALLEEFLHRDPRPEQAAYVNQLLALAPSPGGRGPGEGA